MKKWKKLLQMEKYKVLFNSGYCFDDTIEVEIEANTKQEALEKALAEYPEYSQWNHYIN